VAFKQIRKIVRYGKNSNSVVLPREWLDYYELTNGDELVILGNQVLVIAPKHLEETALVLFYLDRLPLEEEVVYLFIHLSLFLILVKHYVIVSHRVLLSFRFWA